MSIDPRNLSDVISAPRESLDTEIKTWLNFEDNNGRATLAKAIIAIANYGGGLVLLGFEANGSEFVPSKAYPVSLDAYSQDAVNGIVERYIEPCFQVVVEHVEHADGNRYPVIVVPGGHRVPVRARRGAPAPEVLTPNTYYIRRAGPKSEPPSSALEWDSLIKQCIVNSRDELLRGFAALLRTESREQLEASPAMDERLISWVDSAEERMHESFPGFESDNRIAYWGIGYALSGGPVDLGLVGFREVLERTELRLTGWPEWLFLRTEELEPYVSDDEIECVIRRDEARDHVIRAHSDYWRASLDPYLVFFRGYQEDELRDVKSGITFDLTIPIWRVGESLLHARRLAQNLDRSEADACFVTRWHGLNGRKLVSTSRERFNPFPKESRQDFVQTSLRVPVISIEARLAELTKQLLDPVHAVFGFSEVPLDVFQEELERMQGRASERGA